jgi:hypothetical protein
MSYHNGSEAPFLPSPETSVTEGDDRHVERKNQNRGLL